MTRNNVREQKGGEQPTVGEKALDLPSLFTLNSSREFYRTNSVGRGGEEQGHLACDCKGRRTKEGVANRQAPVFTLFSCLKDLFQLVGWAGYLALGSVQS